MAPKTEDKRHCQTKHQPPSNEDKMSKQLNELRLVDKWREMIKQSINLRRMRDKMSKQLNELRLVDKWREMIKQSITRMAAK
jgi:hypothetical protein